jgi:hypothetical protein
MNTHGGLGAGPATEGLLKGKGALWIIDGWEPVRPGHLGGGVKSPEVSPEDREQTGDPEAPDEVKGLQEGEGEQGQGERPGRRRPINRIFIPHFRHDASNRSSLPSKEKDQPTKIPKVLRSSIPAWVCLKEDPDVVPIQISQQRNQSSAKFV